MKLKTILASFAACAIGVSAMALTASAAITNENTGDGKYMLDVVKALPAGCALTDVYGTVFTFEGYDPTQGTGGGVCYQSNSVNWTQKEWGNAASNKPFTFADDNLTVTALFDKSLFAATDEYAQIFIAQWDWGVDIKVTSMKLLGKDGKELGAAAAVTTTTAAAGTTTTTAAGATTTAAAGTATGDAGIALAVAGLSMAGAAAYVARKKH